MSDYQMACLYYPTTTLLVDDSTRFLSHIALSLGRKLPHKLCNDPKEALNALQKEGACAQLPSEIISTDFSSANYAVFTETHPINLNLSNLSYIAYDPLRFSKISVVVVDYAMPKMNGLELCEQLKGLNIKKIMLTGEADERIAVDAFNKGLIDRFIVKNRPEVGKLLANNICHLQKSSFQELSEVVIKGLASEPSSCFTDVAFVSFFNQLCLDLSITDYYLIDTSGSFLLLDEEGRPIWFIVKQDEDVEEVVQQAIETDAPNFVIEALKKREKIAYFSRLRDYSRTHGASWETVLYPAKRLEGSGSKVYFYSIVKNLATFDFEPQKIVTLKDYIETH